MHVLHISNDFPNTELYTQLVAHLDGLGVKQSVYSAVRSRGETQFHAPELNHLAMNIRNIIQPYDRYLFRYKIAKVAKDTVEQVDLSKIDLVHAHTLYSDGAIALRLKKKFGIPYLVAVRSTDLNSFQKYRPDLRGYRNAIIRNAEHVVFISPAHRSRFLDLTGQKLNRALKKKAVTVPNGLDPLFLERNGRVSTNGDSILKLLYVGKFIKRKNVTSIIEAVKILNKEEQRVTLTLVGDGGGEETAVKILADTHAFIHYSGRISDREELRRVYASHDLFVMVSKAETFGLVYIEALSQGTPIIYTKGDGVDGYFEAGSVGVAVNDTHDPGEIASKIRELAGRIDASLKAKCIEESRRFTWSGIAETYRALYCGN